ncbi:E3 ubiquitin-protein ligase Ubr3 isoform X2 [Drosophila navojoa]|uniref:E3 ubiquitin-protein ligase Ubr3 isoform X1 n=1 Tax=Drosophila navojoa TaxID=7232 RepID=UPI0011BE903D|nr:E3 ubiquitin-protein ligase Ubr3 isoform X1 [Drosophila navojoa]XP_030245106.1 E3 ubiquitin-protein ligase Ubr3 isoform X2 [Drosophila navojoa]
MDEDDNISNADISIDEEDDDEPEQQPQQHPQQQQQHPPPQQDNNRRRAGNEDRIDVDEPETYPQQFQLVNVASGSNSTSSSTTSADSGGAAHTGASDSGATGNSPFHDWDTQQSSARSSNSNAGSGLTANADEMNEGGAGNAGAKPSFFFSTSSFILRSRKEVAALINTECCRGSPTPDLDSIMDTLFNPGTPIDNPDNIEWIRWLIAGGRTPKEFVKIVRSYDNHAKCGLVWVPHVVAYRCRTCGISPCMSICRDCFKKGNHNNHDFNMFLSQAGGACDCGDTSVMKAEGFCSDHGINNRVNREPVPNNLLAVAEAIMPKLLFRLLQHFREHSDATLQAHSITSYSCEAFANMLIDLNNMGEIMRKVMTRTLINPDVYSYFMETPCQDTRNGRFLKANREKYEDAVNRFPNPEPPDEYRDLPALGKKLVHTTLLEEFIFWTFKFEFPQTLVCFLLNMLPDQDYKEHLTRTFVMHYSRIPSVLEMSRDPDTLSNRVVHMSVQLFSNESLALKMVNELSLLHVMIISLKLMMSKILIQNTLHDPAKNFHFVIDCTRQVMKDHCYWPLVSDFNNVLSHESVALVFLRDDNLIDMWFQFLQMLQGMNVNVRETASHVEFEPNSYYAAFSCELEASAYPMWSIISHLQDGTHAHLAKKIINYCVTTLHEWLDSIYFREPKLSLEEMMQASFHFPLHRYLAAFVCQAVTKMGISLSDVLPSRPDILPLLMIHPLRVQSFFYEILAGKWVRNGLQIKGQAMTYIQANFCNSMADMDLFFLQICATNLSQYFFLQNTIELFDVGQWLETAPLKQPQKPEQSSMLEGFLTFLATLVTSRTNLGNDEATQCIIEISALLATENKTHSQLLELMPERSGNVHTKNFETFLKKLSVYKAPSSGSENLEQGLFTPIDEVWEEYYDPLHVLLRAVHRRDFQSSLDRFTNYVKSKDKMPASGNLWPPFRLPLPVGSAFTDPCRILNSRLFHSTILSIFFRAVHTRDVSEHLLALAVFLLEIAVETSSDINAAGAGGSSNSSGGPVASPVAMVECEPQHKSGYYYGGSRREPPKLFHCYPTDNLSCNLRHVVTKVSLKSRDPQVTTSSYRSNPFFSDLDFDVDTGGMRMIGDSYGLDDLDETSGAMSVARTQQQRTNNALTRMRMELALVPDLSVVAETGVVLLQPDSSDSDGHDTAMDMSPAGAEFHHFPLQQITLPESGMEVAIRRDLLLAETSTAAAATNDDRDRDRDRERDRDRDRDRDRERDHPRHTGSTNTTNEMFSPTTPTGGGMLLPFQRVRLPVAVPSSNMDVVPSNALSSGAVVGAGGRMTYDPSGGRKRTVDIAIGGPANKDELHMDESILSLLLKLHSQLSGNLDSFSLSDDGGSGSGSGSSSAASSLPMDVDCNEASTSTSTALAERGHNFSSNYKNIQVSNSRIGDGPFFIGNLLRKIATRDELCAQSIDDIRARLWPNQREKQAEARARETKEKEERRKKARERQQKMMQDFANKQKQFMQSAAAAANNMDFGAEDEDDEAMYEEQPREKEYDCIICNCTTPSTETNPIGLVVLVESSGIVGHRRRIAERLPLPLNDADKERLALTTRLATEFARRTELLSLKFGDESWYLSNNMGYDNGVHVQSCGHHVHLSCLEAYLKTLYTTQRQPVQERGEFYCPVCRQLSNSVLPLSPQLDRPTHLVRSVNQPFEQLVADLTDLIKENETIPQPSKLTEAMGHAMEVMTNIAQRKVKSSKITFRKLFIFVTSIARTNLEAEIIQRGGSLCSSNATRYKPKRDCIVPLLHVLSVHVRVLVEWPLWSSWASLAGMPVTDSEPLPMHCLEVIPSLLADPIALLLKFILLAPLHLDQDYFTCMVKVMYNLLYYQIVVQLCVTLTELECDHILANYGDETAPAGSPTTAAADATAAGASSSSSNRRSSSARFGPAQSCAELGRAMALVLNQTNRLTHLRRDSLPSTSSSSGSTTTAAGNSSQSASELNLKSMELQLQSLCLPFLRIAALLRQHLYRNEMPEISAPGLEFVRLVYYLELVTDSMDWDCFNASKGLCFIPGTEHTLPQFWCKQLMDVHPPSDTVRELILMNQHSLWQQPRLLKLPREYERLFTYYHERPCLNCYKVPKESSICLLCGTIVCLKQNCCAEKDCYEAVRHTISCGGGIGIFLVVTSTYIIVIRGRRACLWGSLYLDDFDEEDRDLKRGKPLYLSQDRFDLLESQWLSHKFAHTKHTWVFHRDVL